jgi:trimethylamine--corrinoid protein Co-methyltransferase
MESPTCRLPRGQRLIDQVSGSGERKPSMPPTYLEVLTSDQIEQIHQTALRVLEEVGVWLPNAEVLGIFRDAGAQVDFGAQKVLMPAPMVERAIECFPHAFTWYARSPKYCLAMDGTQTHFSMPDSALNLIDLDGNHRPGTAQDGENICRVCDALPSLETASTGVNAFDMPTDTLAAWHTKTMFVCSSKAVFAVCRSKPISHMIHRMGEVVADVCDHLPDGVLPLMAIMNPLSPLFNEPDQLDGMLEHIRRGLPIAISPEVQAGATGPATVAGLLAQQTAEFLAHAVLAQIVRPGTPVVYGTVSSVFDMRKMLLPYGAPEADLIATATCQLARRYGIPARVTGGSSDSNAHDMQAGAESLMSTLIALLSGASFVLHGAGELENTLAVSFEKILLDDELIGMARRYAQGIEVSPETLAFDVIKEVGPRGHFLDTEHTLEHYRAEQFMPAFLVRERYDTWSKAGSQRAEARAAERARHLLATHQPEPLPPAALAEINAIYTSFVGSAH